jgi:hypothetical protein
MKNLAIFEREIYNDTLTEASEKRAAETKQTYHPINEDLLLMQIVITKIMSSLNNLKAAHCSLQTMLSLNSRVTPVEIRNFLVLLEVYGSMGAPYAFDPSINTLYE